MPDHVRALQQELLDFRKVLLRQDVEEILDPEHLAEIPSSAYTDPLLRALWLRTDRKKDPLIETAVDIFSKAIQLERNRSLEWEWTQLARDLVFKRTEKRSGGYVTAAWSYL